MGIQLTEALAYHPEHPRFAVAWRHLALLSQDGLSHVLGRCWFDPDYPYMQESFRALFDPAAFEQLTSWLMEQGYKRYEAVVRPDNLDYVKCIKGEDAKLGYALFGDPSHYGFTLSTALTPSTRSIASRAFFSLRSC